MEKTRFAPRAAHIFATLFTLGNKRVGGRFFSVVFALIGSYFANSSLVKAQETEAQPTSNTPNAVILLYHHVSDKTPPSTSISPTNFVAHMQYLKENHHIVSLQEVVKALEDNTPLPDKAVAITFDDGYANIFENAHPVLVEMGFPYTIFINPGEIDVGPQQLTWQQVKLMHSEGVTFANHTLDHLHMLNDEQKLGHTAWIENVWHNVTSAQEIINTKLDVNLHYLAYPFGEFNQALTEKLKKNGYIGFGQHSGAVGPYSDKQALPRYPAAGIYANLDTLKTKLNSLAMPVSHATHSEPRLFQRQLDDPVTLTIDSEDIRLAQVTCFFGGEKIATKVTHNTVAFSLDKPLPIGRSRVNCTAPSLHQKGRYYWYSVPFFVANEEGRYPD
ncbi:polysaccharide deacetylase family protein [Alteromonas sp. D210916BOD_24]|uniref:polysaccharide deacetylase family protein n=1 Tax=Alteromonas sp. D210916BOD_24 TaxID=3157618 RepID=UPI00399D4376